MSTKVETEKRAEMAYRTLLVHDQRTGRDADRDEAVVELIVDLLLMLDPDYGDAETAYRDVWHRFMAERAR